MDIGPKCEQYVYTMYIQLLHKQQLGVYYKLINALVLTQFLHTQLHCDSENQTRLHFQMTQAVKQLLIEVWSGLQQTIVDEAIDVSRPVLE